MCEYWLFNEEQDRRVLLLTAADLRSKSIKEWEEIASARAVSTLLHIIAQRYERKSLKQRCANFATAFGRHITCKDINDTLFEIEFHGSDSKLIA